MADTAAPALLPCPFCGSKKQTFIADGSGYFTIECEDCAGTIRKTLSQGFAIDMWNSRPEGDTAILKARITNLEDREKELLAHIQERNNNAAINEEMAQVLEDVHTLCEMGEFKPSILVDFIATDGARDFMQYHRDYHQKAAAERGKAN